MFPSIAARIVYMGLTFLAGVLLAAVALPHDFGSLSLIILNATLFYTISAFGTESAIMLSIGKENWSVAKATTGIAYTIIFQFILFALLQYVLSRSLNISLLTLKNTNLLAFEFIYFIGLMLVEKYSVLYYSFNRAIVCNILLSCTALVYLAIMVSLYLDWFRLEIHPFAVVANVTIFQGIILMLAFHLKKGISFSNLMKRDWKSIFTVSLLVLTCNLIQLVAYRFDYWFIESTLSTSEVGIYAQANKFAQLLWTLPNIVSFILIPKLIKQERMIDFVPFSNSLNVTNVAITGCVVVLCLFFYNYILPADYFDGLYLLLLMLPGYLLFACSIPIAALFFSKGLIKLNLYGSLLCLFLIVILDIILIPQKGYWGAAMANLIAYSVCAFYFFICFRKNAGLPLVSLLKLQFRFSSFNAFR
jgi:O-antigen/teichoic acid export membrane protein